MRLGKLSSCAWLGLAACLVVMLALLARKADEPLREYGAGSQQDPEYLIAGEHFAREGFISTHFVPFAQIGDLNNPPLNRTYPYLHSQPLAFAANGALQKVGLRSIFGLRMVGALLHAAGLVCVFLFARRGTGSASVATIATALTAFSSPLYAHADSIAWYSGMLFFTFAPLALWLREVQRNGAGSPLAWWGVGALLFVQSLYVLITQSGFFCLAFFGLYALCFGVPFPKWKLGLLTVPYAIGALVILARNAWYVGFQAAYDDLVNIVAHRIFGAPLHMGELTVEATIASLQYAPWDVGDWAWTLLERMSRLFFGFRGWAGLVVFFAIVAVLFYRLSRIPEHAKTEREKRFQAMLKFGLVCWAAALPYSIVFMQAIITHHFPGTDFTVGFAVLLSALLWRLSWNSRKLAAALAAVFVLGSAADCVRKDIARNHHFGELARIGAFLPAEAVVGTTDPNAAMPYYVRRPYVRALERPGDVEDFRERASAQFPGRPLYFLLSHAAVFSYEDIRRHLDARYPLELEVGGFRPTRVYRLTADSP